MKKTESDINNILGKKNGRKIAPEGTADIHKTQWMPETHPGTSEVPYLFYPRSITRLQNIWIRKIWAASEYPGKDFAPFEINDVPSKYKLGQVLACGIKAACATYSQHWQGMYFDWTFNSQCEKAIAKLKVMKNNERLVKNAFATVVLVNTGYDGMFMDMLRLRRGPIPPSMHSLEQVDMGTFEHNLKCAVGAALGGHIGVNVIRHSLSKELIEGSNHEGYVDIKELVMIPGMDVNGKISTIIQLGFKQPKDQVDFDDKVMHLAGAKLIERKSERRNADFSKEVPVHVMTRFFSSFNHMLNNYGVKDVVTTRIIKGNNTQGRQVLDIMRECIDKGLDITYNRIIRAYEANKTDNNPRVPVTDFKSYQNLADMIAELGKKVLKPREDGHEMVFIAIDMDKLAKSPIPIDIAEQALGEAIQAGLNSIHLDGTTYVPEGDDLRYGAFCLTGPIHSIELNDTDEQLERGWGQGFCELLAPEITPSHKMIAIIAICAKHEQDAFIAEKQAMEQRKSVNDIFWYRTWNHPEGKRLNINHWISFYDVLHVLPIPGNDVALEEKPLPEYLPEDHPITAEMMNR
ncbi:MAG: hypothetical protein JW920_11190 [Deltaproteobacteria bacterium]|nr:hypothetical protein [Deltaproteobacteria bacterium]